MKLNLLRSPQAMVAPEPTGVSTTSAMTVAPAPAISTSSGNSSEVEVPVNKNDMFEEIKSKFLNEIDKIPRESGPRDP